MTLLEKILQNSSVEPITILDRAIPIQQYTGIDLSSQNKELFNMNIADPSICQLYIHTVLARNNAQVAYGGYLEKRNLYGNIDHFKEIGKSERTIHLGIDFWAKAGTEVLTPISGMVHSFKNNAFKGDYGPTIILVHEIEKIQFHTLYGHLSLESLEGLYMGKQFKQGEVLATLGTPDINMNYAPHLHFQIIRDIGDHQGDYPGVSNSNNLPYYIKNCPDPNILLKL